MQKFGLKRLAIGASLLSTLSSTATQPVIATTPAGATTAADAGIKAAQVAQAAGSTGQQAISAAAQAGMMYRLLMVKGIMDYLQRQEMDQALEKLNKKLEAVKKEAASGKISPAQLAAIKAAVDEAYAKNAKVETPKDKEVGPDLKFKSEKSNLQFEDLSDTDGSSKNSPEKTALQANDILQSQTKESISSKESLEGKSSSEAGALKKGGEFFGQGMSSQPYLLGDQGNPGSQNLSIHNSAESDSSSKDKMAESKVSMNLEKDSESISGERGFARDFEFTESAFPADLAETPEGLKREVSELRSPSGKRKTEAHLGGGIAQWLKPIKFQTNPFSTQLHSEEGLHPLILLLILGAAFVLGRRLSFSKKVPVVIPEVVREHPRAHSQSLVLSRHVSGRRRARRN